MNLQRQFLDQRLSRLIGAALTAGVGVLLVCGPLGRGLVDRSYDFLFHLRPHIDVSGESVVIVAMDAESEKVLNQPSVLAWKRSSHAQLIEQLQIYQADVLVFDVMFRNPTTNLAPADVDLLRAAEAHGKVIFAAVLEGKRDPKDQAIGGRVELPFGANRRVRIDRVGLVEHSFDPAMHFRQHYPGKLGVPSLTWRAAQLTLAEPLHDPLTPRWMNYYGPSFAVPYVSYWRVISNALPASLSLTNKVVFVGARTDIGPTAGSGTDKYQTPFGGRPMPGVEINATAYLNLVRGDWLRRWQMEAEAALIGLLGASVGGGLARYRPLRAAVLALFAAIIVIAVAALLFGLAHFWFPWLIVVAVQIPLALGWSAFAHTMKVTREKEALEEKLATDAAAATPVIAPAPGVSVARQVAIPDHTLLRCVGRGGYGEVWLARDIVGNFRVVKIIHRNTFPDEKPFDREFKGIQKYSPISRSHPGWIDILHVGRNEAQGYFFYIMEAGDDETSGQRIEVDRYTPKTLAGELLNRGRLPLEECVSVSLALADALGHLHRHSLIHRDIKPSNVIYVNGAPKFADIGLVTDMSGTGRDVSFLGTAGYIAPEGPGTPAADIYSLGKLIYEASMGRDRRAFPEMPTEVLERSPGDPVSELSRIIFAACEYNPSERYPSAAALHADLIRLRNVLSNHAQ